MDRRGRSRQRAAGVSTAPARPAPLAPFQIPADWRIGAAERLILHLGAVDYDAKVWVNGELVATHRGGYAAFDVDVTDAVTPGDAPQELIVWAEDRTDATWQPIGKQRREPDRGIFYQGSSGIWRTVWLEPVPDVHITALDLTPDLPRHSG